MTEAYEGSQHYQDNVGSLHDLWEKLSEDPAFASVHQFPVVAVKCAKGHRVARIRVLSGDRPFPDFPRPLQFEIVGGGGVDQSHPGAAPSVNAELVDGQVVEVPAGPTIGDTRSTFVCPDCARKNPGHNIPLRTSTLLLHYAAAVKGGKKQMRIDGDTLR